MFTFAAMLLTDARQTGKTTLPRAEADRTHRYVSLERPGGQCRGTRGCLEITEHETQSRLEFRRRRTNMSVNHRGDRAV